MSKVRIGVSGAGWWATTNHLRILAQDPRVELVGVCRKGPAELAQVKEDFGFAYATEEYQELLDLKLDAMVIASPHHFHYPQACQALERGLHVIVEKPMTTSAVDAYALARKADEAGKHIMVPHGWSFRPYGTQAREWISEGRVGEISHIAMQMASPTRQLFSGERWGGSDMFDEKDNDPDSDAEKVTTFEPSPSTYNDRDNFGGYGWGQLPHLFGLAFNIAPSLNPTKVYALQQMAPAAADLFTAATVAFSNGETGVVSGVATVPLNSPFQVDVRIYGTEGMLLLDVERERLVLRRDDDDNADFHIAEGDGDYLCEEPIRRFVSLCLGEQEHNEAGGWVGAKSVALLEAIYESAKSDKPVDVLAG